LAEGTAWETQKIFLETLLADEAFLGVIDGYFI
jgi:hypothetical protein